MWIGVEYEILDVAVIGSELFELVLQNSISIINSIKCQGNGATCEGD